MPEQPAVPPFHGDADIAFRELGKSILYMQQLSTLLVERAQEANRLDEERLEVLRANVDLTTRLHEAHEQIAKLEADLRALSSTREFGE